MRRTFLFTALVLLACTAPPAKAAPQGEIRVVHVFVALADNQYQGIVPVPAKLGDGDAPWTNLYWGAAYGVKSYFRSSTDWEMVSDGAGPSEAVLERCVFRHRGNSVYLVADAYRGREIRQAIIDFLSAAAGRNVQAIVVNEKSGDVQLGVYGGADLIAYVGDDAFMDFQVDPVVGGTSGNSRAAVILACASKPDPDFPGQDYRSYRHSNWVIPTSREYAFSLIRRSHEGPGPLHYYWLAKVRVADSVPIFTQLERLHKLHPEQTLAEIEPQIRIKTWKINGDQCSGIKAEADRFLALRFTAPFSNGIVLDGPTDEFEVSSMGTYLKLSLRDGEGALVAWAEETRTALAKCGAEESAVARGQD